MKRDIVWTTRFKKDYKLAIKRHMNIDLLDDRMSYPAGLAAHLPNRR